MSEADTLVSHETPDGRILSGVGADVADLEATMERHAPPVEPAKEPATAPATAAPVDADKPGQPRNEAGQFDKAENAELTFPDGSSQKPLRGRKRFEQLHAHAEAWRRHAEGTARELEQLRARPASEPPSGTPSTARSAPVAPAPKAETRAKPKEDEIGTKYQTYGDYVEDLADWKAEQRLAQIDFDARIRTSLEAERASRTFTEKVSSVLEAGRKAYADFEAVRGASDVMFPQPVLDLIMSLDAPEHVIYQLAKDRVLAEKIARSNPYQAGMELSKLVTPAAVASPASTARTVAPPPLPYQPVGGGSKTTVPSSASLAASAGDEYDRSGYRESRARERGVRTRW